MPTLANAAAHPVSGIDKAARAVYSARVSLISVSRSGVTPARHACNPRGGRFAFSACPFSRAGAGADSPARRRGDYFSRFRDYFSRFRDYLSRRRDYCMTTLFYYIILLFLKNNIIIKSGRADK